MNSPELRDFVARNKMVTVRVIVDKRFDARSLERQEFFVFHKTETASFALLSVVEIERLIAKHKSVVLVDCDEDWPDYEDKGLSLTYSFTDQKVAWLFTLTFA